MTGGFDAIKWTERRGDAPAFNRSQREFDRLCPVTSSNYRLLQLHGRSARGVVADADGGSEMHPDNSSLVDLRPPPNESKWGVAPAEL